MKANEIKERGAVDEIILKITAKEEARDVRGGELRVCNLTGEDETGTITVTLWNDEIEKVNVGDKIKITKGWANSYNDLIQVSAGKFGQLEVLKD